eukprot:TRINITY_DN0_c1_g1_i4.p1 TRINITY_DN0_c1_g1~~TRINITY_DN0_c1_g1_i4.p1  ORF type:complete len:253 (-),score=-11.58 TRINITY_DN0_c1_g1_i4:3833-4522(-)
MCIRDRYQRRVHGQKSPCVIAVSSHHKAVFQLDSRIPLVRFSSELTVFCTGRAEASLALECSSMQSPLSPAVSTSTRLSHQGPCTQSSEPIHFPKLRIYFAEFPYLLFSIDQRLLTLETCCGYWYDPVCKQISYSDFQGSSRTHLTPHIVRCSARHWALALDNPISRLWPVKKKRELFQGYAPTFLSSLMLPYSIHIRFEEYQPHSLLTSRASTSCLKEFPYVLGSNNP